MFSQWCGIVVLAAIMSPTLQAADRGQQDQPKEAASAPVPPSDTITVSKQAVRPAYLVGASLRNLSQQAFHRGLLPLTDLLEHLALAEEADLRHVLSTVSEASAPLPQLLQPALQPRVDALRQAVRHMEGFHQPAAANWHADLLLGKYVLSQAEAEVGRLTGSTEATARAMRVESAMALAHYQQRIFDARILGHASLPEVTRAISFLNIDPTRKRRALQQSVRSTERWNSAGAGIGRTDRVLEASLQVALWDAEPRSSTPDEVVVKRGLSEAERLTTHLFATQRRYYSHGTATLADLSRTWQTRRQVHLLADFVGTAITESSPASYERDLNDLRRLASSVQDRRGRIAGDVEFVQLLHYLHAGDQIRTTDVR